jgi:hypothetical protein
MFHQAMQYPDNGVSHVAGWCKSLVERVESTVVPALGPSTQVPWYCEEEMALLSLLLIRFKEDGIGGGKLRCSRSSLFNGNLA